jgi:cytochrome c biogenesis protein CcmG/thiol:disulfide interchange protein DsbE
MWRYFLPLIIFGLLFMVLTIGMGDIREGKNVSDLPSPLIDKPAPQFELPSLTDPSATVSTSDFSGFLLELSESGTIPVYGLNWRDNGPEAQRWLQQLGDPYVDTAFDEDGRVGIDWGVYGAPETFLIGPDGTVLYRHLGPLNWGLWQERFIPLLESSG